MSDIIIPSEIVDSALWSLSALSRIRPGGTIPFPPTEGDVVACTNLLLAILSLEEVPISLKASISMLQSQVAAEHQAALSKLLPATSPADSSPGAAADNASGTEERSEEGLPEPSIKNEKENTRRRIRREKLMERHNEDAAKGLDADPCAALVSRFSQVRVEDIDEGLRSSQSSTAPDRESKLDLVPPRSDPWNTQSKVPKSTPATKFGPSTYTRSTRSSLRSPTSPRVLQYRQPPALRMSDLERLYRPSAAQDGPPVLAYPTPICPLPARSKSTILATTFISPRLEWDRKDD